MKNNNKKNNYRSHYHCVFHLKYHLVLVTKYRKKCINSSILQRLNEIAKKLCDKWDISLDEFNGEQDHVHLLLSMHPNIMPSKFVNNLKTVTSRLIRKEFSQYLSTFFWKPVFWSRAYCLISAGGAPIEVLKKYIENQNRPT